MRSKSFISCHATPSRIRSHRSVRCSLAGVEEEKKSDDMSHNGEGETVPSPKDPPTPSFQQQQQQQTTTTVGKPSPEPKPVGWVGQSCRFLFLDLPLFVLLSLYAGMQLADYAKEQLFSAQYEGLIWDAPRKMDEIT